MAAQGNQILLNAESSVSNKSKLFAGETETCSLDGLISLFCAEHFI